MVRVQSHFLKTAAIPAVQNLPAGNRVPTGSLFDSQGRLVFCQHGNRAISRLEKDGKRTVLADRYNGKRINSPNDVIVKSNDDIYFTDPPFGLPKAFDDPARELDFCGVYRLSPSGKVTLLTREVEAPNGIAFTKDEKTLYVSDSRRFLWLAFDVQPDGTLGKSRVLYDASGYKKSKPGVADGLKSDIHGNIFGAGPGGIYVISPDGTLLGRFDLGVATGNCAWGEDGSTLFIAGNTALYRVRLKTKGAGY
jgi:gluconolactonase